MQSHDYMWLMFVGVLMLMWFGERIWKGLREAVFGGGQRPTVRSEVHGLLEIAVKQTAVLVEMRDLMRGSLTREADLADIADTIPDALRPLHDLLLSINSHQENCDEHLSYSATALGELRAHALQAVKDRQEFMEGESSAIVPFREDFRVAIQTALGQINTLLAVIQKQGGEQLEALQKLDQRLFEFVNATKGIMRAIQGNSGDDQDVLIEDAKMIQARAADRGVEITLEDAIKRARNQAVYRQ